MLRRENPRSNGTKIWITEAGKALVVEWKDDINKKDQKNIFRMIEANSSYIVNKWIGQFGESRFYC